MKKVQANVCGFCKRGVQAEDVCGELHVQDTGSGVISAHHKCMQYSALLTQYKFKSFGGFKTDCVQKEILRGKKLSCSICKSKTARKENYPKTGATSGCALKRCNKTYHFYCASIDDTVITKRLVVNLKHKDLTAVLYRVFCSKDHHIKYVEELKSEKEKLFSGEDSETSSDISSEWEDWPASDQVAHSVSGHSVLESLPTRRVDSPVSGHAISESLPTRRVDSPVTGLSASESLPTRRVDSPVSGHSTSESLLTQGVDSIVASSRHNSDLGGKGEGDYEHVSSVNTHSKNISNGQSVCSKRKPHTDAAPKAKRLRENSKNTGKLLKVEASLENSEQDIFTIKKTNGDYLLPKRFLPVVKLSSKWGKKGDYFKSCDTSTSNMSTASSASSMCSNKSGASGSEHRHPYLFSVGDLSQRQKDVPSDTVAVCVFGDLKNLPDRQEELSSLIQTRYDINKDCVYFWHQVVQKHGMLSSHMLPFLSDLTECLRDCEMTRFVQLLLCPQANGLLEKYQNILEFQEKLEGSIRWQLCQGICKTVSKGMKKASREFGVTVGELLPSGDGCALVLLMNSTLTGCQELLNIFPQSQAILWPSSPEILHGLDTDQIEGADNFCELSRATDIEEELNLLKRWIVTEVKGPVHVQTRPIEKKLLCAEGYQQSSTALQISHFLAKIYAPKNLVQDPNMEVLCAIKTDIGVVNPLEYLLRVLKSFFSSSADTCYVIADLCNLDVKQLILDLRSLEEAVGKRVRTFCVVDPVLRNPNAVVIKAWRSKQFPVISEADNPVTEGEKEGDDSGQDSPESGSKTLSPDLDDGRWESDVETTSPLPVKYVEDGEVPSTSKYKPSTAQPQNTLKLTRTDSGQWRFTSGNKHNRVY